MDERDEIMSGLINNADFYNTGALCFNDREVLRELGLLPDGNAMEIRL